MKIKALKSYFDKQLGKNININDEYDVPEERGNQIIAVGFAMEIPTKEIEEEVKEEKIVKKEKKTTRKKK